MVPSGKVRPFYAEETSRPFARTRGATPLAGVPFPGHFFPGGGVGPRGAGTRSTGCGPPGLGAWELWGDGGAGRQP